MIDFNIDSVAWREDVSEADLVRLRRYYAANVTMIDTQVGQIIEALEARGYLDDTIIIFCSDHADALGDHGHIQKWTMYDCVTRVPLVFWAPGRVGQSVICPDLVQLMDIAPTILDFAGVETPDNWEAWPLTPMVHNGIWTDGKFRQHVYAELGRDHIQSASELVIMRRDHEWKIVVYPAEDDGELYDLVNDPGETKNLWHDPVHRQMRDDAVRDVLAWSALGTFRANRPKTPKPQAPMKVN
jgi:arylsulfatase A-like enzyme